MPLNEADTRAQLIDPQLKAAGWSDSLITREHFYRRDHRYTAGRIYPVGDDARRREPRRVDYLLRYTDAFPIAVVEAKDESHSPNAGLEQAKRYARELGLAFAYSSNGHGIVEYDFFTHGSRDLTGFPTPDELWERWLLNTGATEPERARAVARPETRYAADRHRNPLLHPYCPRSQCGKEPFYFQETAISQVLPTKIAMPAAPGDISSTVEKLGPAWQADWHSGSSFPLDKPLRLSLAGLDQIGSAHYSKVLLGRQGARRQLEPTEPTRQVAAPTA